MRVLFLRISNNYVAFNLKYIGTIVILFLQFLLYRNNRSDGEWHIEFQTLPVTAGSDFFDKQSAIITHFRMYKCGKSDGVVSTPFVCIFSVSCIIAV